MLHIITPCAGCAVCTLVNSETLLEFRSELRSDALPVTAIDFSEIRTLASLNANRNQ